MKYIKLGLLFFVIAMFGFTALSPLDNYISKMRFNEVERFPEKTYIHTDKPFYTTKDTIWFKNYLVNGITHKQTTKSNVVYVELISPKDSILYHKKFYVADNTYSAPGEIAINPKWEAGEYQLRSYTNYMRNQEEGFFFKKSIQIEREEEPKEALAFIDNKKLNASVKDLKIDDQKKNLGKIKLIFYPEGGNVLANVINKFGIKATDEKGNGVKVIGAIKEKGKDEVITSFRTFDFGLGNMAFIPKENVQYTAEIQLNGKIQRYVLDQASTNGVQLNINNNSESLSLKVTANNVSLKDYFLIGHIRGKLFYTKKIEVDRKTVSYKLITKDLPNGVTHFTLFDANGKPKSERLVFIDNYKSSSKVRIILNKKEFKKRDLVSYNVEVLDTLNVKKNASLSLSVTQKNVVPLLTRENIKSWLLLNSDLKGEIPNAAVFFDPQKSVNEKAYLLESLMLTHGWRRFKWEDYLAEEYKKLGFEPEKGITISGKVLALDKEVYNKEIETTMILLGKGVFSEKQKVKANAKFEFKNIVIKDTTEAILQAKALGVKAKKEKKIKFLLDKKSTNRPKIISSVKATSEKENLFFENYKKIKNYINQVNFTLTGSSQLDEVIIEGKKRNEAEDYYDDIVSGFSNAEYTYPSDRIIVDSLIGSETLTVFDLLSRVPGVRVIGNNRVSIRGGSVSSSGSVNAISELDVDDSSEGGPLFLLDGFEISIEEIGFLSGSDILLVDVLKGNDAAGFGSRGANGVIAIYSKIDSDIIVEKEKPGIVNFTLTPFYKAREFYDKNYFKVDDTQIIEPDHRTTLHWNPAANAYKNHIVNKVFYTGDQLGVYQFELEGITEDGELIYETTEIEIVE